jgi:hypothetical protein
VPAIATENRQTGLPHGRDPGVDPVGQFGLKGWIAGGEVLRAMVGLPAVSAPRTHAASGAAAFIKERNWLAGIKQGAGRRQTSNAGTDDCERFVHFVLDKIIKDRNIKQNIAGFRQIFSFCR